MSTNHEGKKKKTRTERFSPSLIRKEGGGAQKKTKKVPPGRRATESLPLIHELFLGWK